MIAWNWVAIDFTDRTSHFGPGFMSRDEAIADTEPIFRAVAQARPEHAEIVGRWLAGTALDDTVRFGPFVYGLYRYDPVGDDDMRVEAELWMVDFAGRAGIDLERGSF